MSDLDGWHVDLARVRALLEKYDADVTLGHLYEALVVGIAEAE